MVARKILSVIGRTKIKEKIKTSALKRSISSLRNFLRRVKFNEKEHRALFEQAIVKRLGMLVKNATGKEITISKEELRSVDSHLDEFVGHSTTSTHLIFNLVRGVGAGSLLLIGGAATSIPAFPALAASLVAYALAHSGGIIKRDRDARKASNNVFHTIFFMENGRNLLREKGLSNEEIYNTAFLHIMNRLYRSNDKKAMKIWNWFKNLHKETKISIINELKDFHAQEFADRVAELGLISSIRTRREFEKIIEKYRSSTLDSKGNAQ